MKDTSKRRRLAGRIAIFAAAAVALPLTATVVPVFAEDAPSVDAPEKITKHKKKIVMIRNTDGELKTLDMSGDVGTPFVTKIEKDGKVIILHSDKELSKAELEQMIADAEASAGDAETAQADAEAAQADAEAAQADAEAAMADAEMHRAEALAIVSNMDFASVVPEIDISEVRGKCKDGHPVSTAVSGFDGTQKSRVKVVLCGKGQAKAAKLEAIKGLREARDEIASEEDMPKNIRKSVMESLDKQIERMKKELAQTEDGGDA